jgi:hypothetical protein
MNTKQHEFYGRRQKEYLVRHLRGRALSWTTAPLLNVRASLPRLLQ